MSVLDLGLHTTLTHCGCPEFSSQTFCRHICRLHQELVYFNTGWNPYRQQFLCLCSAFELDGDCAHIAFLQSLSSLKQVNE